MRINVRQCQRCGKDHLELVFKPLTNPVNDWQWWTMCPETGEPVLAMVKVVQDNEADRQE